MVKLLKKNMEKKIQSVRWNSYMKGVERMTTSQLLKQRWWKMFLGSAVISVPGIMANVDAEEIIVQRNGSGGVVAPFVIAHVEEVIVDGEVPNSSSFVACFNIYMY